MRRGCRVSFVGRKRAYVVRRVRKTSVGWEAYISANKQGYMWYPMHVLQINNE